MPLFSTISYVLFVYQASSTKYVPLHKVETENCWPSVVKSHDHSSIRKISNTTPTLICLCQAAHHRQRAHSAEKTSTVMEQAVVVAGAKGSKVLKFL